MTLTQLIGSSYFAADFKLQNVSRNALAEELLPLLAGTTPVIIIREALSPTICRALVDAFNSSPCRHPRDDSVSGSALGAYHYGQSFEDYAREVTVTNHCIREFLAAGADPVQQVLQTCEDMLKPLGIALRPAKWRNVDAALARAASWTAPGDYMLAPHDDLGQLTDPQQDGFEAQRVAGHTVVAVNFYPRVPAGGGLLRLWNIIPTQEAREKLGIACTGYPIPEDLLTSFDSLDINVDSGSLVMMNGGLVHAVTGYPLEKDNNRQDQVRLMFNFFMGYSDESTVVHWV